MSTSVESQGEGFQAWQFGWDADQDQENDLVGQFGEEVEKVENTESIESIEHIDENTENIQAVEEFGDNTSNSFMPDPAGDFLTSEDQAQGASEGFEDFADVPDGSESTSLLEEVPPSPPVEASPNSPRDDAPPSKSLWERMSSRIDEIVDYGRRRNTCVEQPRCPSSGDILMVVVAVLAIALLLYLFLDVGRKPGHSSCSSGDYKNSLAKEAFMKDPRSSYAFGAI